VLHALQFVRCYIIELAGSLSYFLPSIIIGIGIGLFSLAARSWINTMNITKYKKGKKQANCSYCVAGTCSVLPKTYLKAGVNIKQHFVQLS